MRRLLFLLLAAALCGVAGAASAEGRIEEVLERIFEEVGVDIDIDEDALVRVSEEVSLRGGERLKGDVLAVRAGVRVSGGSRVDGTVVAVGGNVRVSGGGVVDGDVVAVNGDVHLSGGSSVEGEAIAIGGHVYRSTGSSVDGKVLQIRVDDQVGRVLEDALAIAATMAPTVEYDVARNAAQRVERTRTQEKDLAGFGDVIEIPQDVRHKGDVAVFGGVLDVAGELDGDVVAVGSHVRVFTTGEISGEMATFGSQVERDVPLTEFGKKPAGSPSPRGSAFGHRHEMWEHEDFGRPMAVVGLIMLGAFGIVVLLFNLLLEPVLESAEVELTQGYARSFLVGLLLEATIPPLAALLIVIFVLAPVGVLLILAFALGGTVAMGLVSRRLGRRLLGGPGANGTMTRTLAGYGLLVALAAFGQMLFLVGAPAPVAWICSVLGYFVVITAVTLGLGAVALAQFGRWNRTAPPRPESALVTAGDE